MNNKTKLLEDLRYATYSNRDRDAINTALFEEWCKLLYNERGCTNDTIIILADSVEVKSSSGSYEPFKNKRTFWINCGEDDIKFGTGRAGRMDPMLKLFYRCQLMLPFNNNVSGREANGTNARLKKVNLSSDVHPMIFKICGKIPIKAVYASQVLSVKLLHTNQKIIPQTFLVKPKERYFNANILKPRALQVKDDDHETLKMKATQLPVISNHATTGHKLQGASVDKLFIHSWSYTMNWPYVVLSTLRMSEGLFSSERN